MSESEMSETEIKQEGRRLSDTKPKRRQVIKPFEIVLIVGFVIIVAVLLHALISDINENHEVSQGTALSNKVVSSMEKQDTAALRALGTKQFQAIHTAAELYDKLTFKTTPPITFAQLYGKNGKRSIVSQTVVNNSNGKHVIVLYRYDKLKVPMYVRIIALEPNGSSHWYLQQLDASPDESTLI
jgi:hypothetical protein